MKRLVTVAVLVVVVAVAALALWRDAAERRALARAEIRAAQQAAFDRKAGELERMLTLTYQGIRTISLLPTVRGLSGGNLPADFHAPDGAKFDRARFSADAEATVQQLYNNLATNVSVSEVYAILDGFQPERGETPFFMFDEVRVDGLGAAAADDDAAADADEPDEEEGEEYAYYVRLLAELRARQPTLDLATTPLAGIPAYTSPVLRTCDNSQYTSRAHGDARDAAGFTISVPVYRADTTLVGVVSAIVRVDALEAALRGEPYLLITDADRARAAAAGWRPGPPARFVLRNAERDFVVADRQLDLRRAERAAGGLRLSRTLAAPTVEHWTLDLYVPAAVMAAQDGAIMTTFATRLAGVVVLVAIIGAWLLLAERQRGRLLAAVRDIVGSADQVRAAAAEVSHASDRLASGSATQAASVQETSAAIEEIAATATQNAEHARVAKAHVAEARVAADGGAARMGELVSAMAAIRGSSDEIARIVHVSDEIAFQTHVLALNAAVEAARAGEAGASFAVVASEVRNLAHRSAEAARETTELVQRAIDAAVRGADLTAEVQASLRVIVDAVHHTDELTAHITAASTEQARAVAQCNGAVGQVSRVAQDVAATAGDVAAAAGSATEHATELVHRAQALVGGDGGAPATSPAPALPQLALAR